MKIVFAGTPEFAAQAMRAIHAAGHEIVLALTQPDRRAGRGMHLQASPVKEFALEKNIPVLQPETLRRNNKDPEKQQQAEDAYRALINTNFDAMVVVAYGLILPQEILDITQQAPRFGSFNIHASLLPRWRGAAPIQRAIEAGDAKTGVCIMQMEAGLDTGDVVLTADLAIASDETSSSLHDRLAALGAGLIVDALSLLQDGKGLSRTPQPALGVTYAEKILKAEADLDWSLSAREIDARIRAFNPFPGAISNLNAETIKLWKSRLADEDAYSEAGPIGAVIGFSEDGVFVRCGDGVIEILEVQKPGGKKMNAKTCLQSVDAPEKLLCFQTKA
ncbi:methionyl-tRNA formyltransferase [Polynucleobacter asymbioticus]|jgi:methionyl-tRNA formyltransferase|uniref:Methionyl-tRNA formyltransferase n=1 Tax=Polynucleobacter asymbioticus TaxID=576611 RepID=A0AAC9IYI4_9BURK|nr:methionyl-tRNA formyltransferase [Polynucleobacter asymbioticus]APB99955.1 methionyl-tRNA formyltransferase [Polynucleobacter asymbioticus]APC02258.1 methionyl-tRNA formyltransferase [Polynucleobacter asymbioticus]